VGVPLALRSEEFAAAQFGPPNDNCRNTEAQDPDPRSTRQANVMKAAPIGIGTASELQQDFRRMVSIPPERSTTMLV